jgi:hypothetical protein
LIAALGALLAGCSLIPPVADRLPGIAITPRAVESTAPATAPPFTLERDIHEGICFSAAWDAAGQVFVFRDAEAHIHFYDLADHSRLCEFPVRRAPFAFVDGQILAGLWSRGRGCTADHRIVDFVRDDEARTIHMRLELIIGGDCPYDLLRPFWVALPAAADYAVTIEVVEGG